MEYNAEQFRDLAMDGNVTPFALRGAVRSAVDEAERLRVGYNALGGDACIEGIRRGDGASRELRGPLLGGSGMTDFVSIRRRAETMQENSGLGTPEHALSRDALELLRALKPRYPSDIDEKRCDDLRQVAERARVFSRRAFNEDRHNDFLEACDPDLILDLLENAKLIESLKEDHEQAKEQIAELKAERDEALASCKAANEQGARWLEIAQQRGDQLDALQAERDEARELHAKVCAQYGDLHASIERARASYARLQARNSPDPAAVSQNGAFVGPVPHE